MPHNAPSDPATAGEVTAKGAPPTREYVQPEIISHSGEEILEDLGPAQACYMFGGGGTMD